MSSEGNEILFYNQLSLLATLRTQITVGHPNRVLTHEIPRTSC